MANTNTDHSKKLRKKTAAARRDKILEDKGRDLRVLLKKNDAMMLAEIQKWNGSGNKPATATDTLLKLIKEAFWQIPQPDLTEEEVEAAFGAGTIACSNGQKRGDNPHIEGTSLYQEWDNGWCQYDADYNPDYYSSPLAEDL